MLKSVQSRVRNGSKLVLDENSIHGGLDNVDGRPHVILEEDENAAQEKPTVRHQKVTSVF